MLTDDVASRAWRRVGTILCGKWHLDAVLGVGGMATVFAATHRNRNRVAIKLLHPELSLEPAIRTRFLREGYVANTVEHPAAVRVLDDDVAEDGAAFLVMELLEGESLEERCRRLGGHLSLSEALQITERLLDVLAAAHERGILHRDIKPENLFITTAGELKVLDFGIARFRQGTGSTRAGSFMGTPGYTAPEQARGRWNQVDERSDVFAAGATLFAALAGRQVHQAETPSEQLALAIGTSAPAFTSVVPDIRPDVAAIIDRALAYDKADRWPDARSMQLAIREVLEELPAEPLAGAPKRAPELRTITPTTSTSFGSPGDGANRMGSMAGTTVPASPQALASMRRIVTGVVVAACAGLTIGLGTWWVTRMSLTRDVESPVIVPARAESAPEPREVLSSSIAPFEEAPADAPTEVGSADKGKTKKVTASNELAARPQAAPSPDAQPATDSAEEGREQRSGSGDAPSVEALRVDTETAPAKPVQPPTPTQAEEAQSKAAQPEAAQPKGTQPEKDAKSSGQTRTAPPPVKAETHDEGRTEDRLPEDPFERRY